MDHQRAKHQKRLRRRLRVSKRVRGTSERPRLCVFRTLKHMYAQVIDDEAGQDARLRQHARQGPSRLREVRREQSRGRSRRQDDRRARHGGGRQASVLRSPRVQISRPSGRAGAGSARSRTEFLAIHFNYLIKSNHRGRNIRTHPRRADRKSDQDPPLRRRGQRRPPIQLCRHGRRRQRLAAASAGATARPTKCRPPSIKLKRTHSAA